MQASTVVGYRAGEGTGGSEFPSFGATFLAIDGGDTYPLGSVKAELMDADQDMLQEIDPDECEPITYYTYVTKEYCDAAAAFMHVDPTTLYKYIGWWDVTDGPVDLCDEAADEQMRQDYPMPVGLGFLGSFSSGEDVVFTSSGAVPLSTKSIFTEGHEFPYIANFIPTEIPYGWIEMKAIDADQDMFQVIDPDECEPVLYYTYVTKDYCDAAAAFMHVDPATLYKYIGWWDVTDGPVDLCEEAAEIQMINAENIIPGASFLGSCSSGEDIEIVFPSALRAE